MHPSWHLDISKPRYSLLGSYEGVGGSCAGATWLCVVGFLIKAQSAPDGVSSSFGAISGIGFIQNASHVISNGVDADEQILGYLPVQLASGNQADHFHFNLGETIGKRRSTCWPTYEFFLKLCYFRH